MLRKIKKELYEFKVFLNSLPSLAVLILTLAVFAMNLLANKSISLPFSWMALDCGTLVSWIVFLTMDIVTKHFGPKAATELSVFTVILNLFFSLIFFIASVIPGVWGEADTVFVDAFINEALDKTFGGTWYIIFGSTVAFLVAAAVNNFSNFGIGRIFKNRPDSFSVYIARSYISTAIGQLVDNLTFSLIVSRVFFGWSLLQCLASAVTTMLVEVLCELIFAKAGYKICIKWKKKEIGREYFALREGREGL